jgi:hypothetical protein
MPDFTWKTEMRRLDDAEARHADRLRGQAALMWLSDGRAQLIVLPDTGTLAAEMVMSVEDARALARAITEADQPGEVRCPYTFAHTRHWCGYDGCRES